jgi:hypothetical protein
MVNPAKAVETVNEGDCFFFILNPLMFTGTIPFEMIPGCFLQKPNRDQLLLIQERLDGFRIPGGWPKSFHLGYNSHWVPHPTAKPESKAGRLEAIHDPKDWRYWIVRYVGKLPHKRDENSIIGKLRCAADLIQNDLDIGFGFLYAPPPYGPMFFLTDNATFTYLTEHQLQNDPLVITPAELGQIGANFSLVEAAEKQNPKTYKLAQQFASLKSLPRKSDMQVLGYFSILEALFTHKPKLNEADSLTHQIRTKMPMLSARFFDRQLDYTGQFGNTPPETIWKALYDYRSKLAHGDQPDIKADFQSLRDFPTAVKFLKEAVKLSLLLGLKDPDLLEYLKKI